MSLFTTYIYQPFFNVLVGIYWALSQVTPEPDMGLAVIIFAVIVRLVTLPLGLAGDKTAAERNALVEKLEKLRHDFKHSPAQLRQEEKKLFRSHPAAVISETVVIAIQFIIIIMLYRIFKTGLEGADLHLLYDFMPEIPQPINLTFLGRFDLSRPNPTLNLIQSLAILTLESLAILFSDRPTTRREFLSLAIFLPLASYFIFALLPAGKKVFIITTLCFSIVQLIVRQLYFWYYKYLVPASFKKQAA